jgi:uncharacterized protein (DUF2252 family)
MSASEKDNRDDMVDEEEAFPPIIPREISFKRPQQNDDDDTLPSELSLLIAPSALTHHDNVSGGPLKPECGPNDSLGSSMSDSRKAFQLAAMIGMLSLGMLFGADFVYIMSMAESESSTMNSHAAMDLSFDDGIWSAKDWTDSLNVSPGGDSSKIESKARKDKAGKKREKYEINDDVSPVNDGEIGWEVETDVDYDDNAGLDYDDDAHEASRTMQTPIDDVHKLLITDSESSGNVSVPQAYERCSYVVETFEDLNEGMTDMNFLREKYATQSVDANVFYRATALLFWKDFASGGWGSEQGKSIDLDDLVLLKDAKYDDGSPMSLKSTWTWITGDQHLSNFGAWRNRGGDVVFSVNDFDEAAIFDFHIDVLRVAVSICNHGFTNGFVEDDVKDALEAFTYTYVKTAIDYVGGDAELTFELNAHTSTGVMRDFLWDVEREMSLARQIHKFTEVGSDGLRRFSRNNYTRLEDVPPRMEKKIRGEITSTRYGASMMHMGWKVRGWDDDFFTVLDVAQRVGSGIGSYGVDRFYVLLKGEDMLIEEDEGVLSSSVILDVKYEPMSAVSRIINGDDFVDRDIKNRDIKSWYKYLFRNEADRAAQAQRRLTSYTDPYVGYLDIDGDSYIVRQRSPYKSSFDVNTLTYPRAFSEFVEQIAIETATAVSRLL